MKNPIHKYNYNNTYICPRRSDPFYKVTCYIKWVTTSWTDSIKFVCTLCDMFVIIAPNVNLKVAFTKYLFTFWYLASLSDHFYNVLYICTFFAFYVRTQIGRNYGLGIQNTFTLDQNINKIKKCSISENIQFRQSILDFQYISF